MKKTQKRILGLFSLFLVAAITSFAASLPMPEAQAAPTTSVTDQITLRVLSTHTDVEITEPKGDPTFIHDNVKIAYNYENARTITISGEYTDASGTTHPFTHAIIDFADYTTASGEVFLSDIIAQNSLGYGYGDYKITIQVDAPNVPSDYDSITFSYYPVIGTAEEDDNYNVPVSLNYDAGEENIKKIVIEVYDENGNLINIDGLSPVIVNPPIGGVTLPFSEYGLDSGNYIIHVSAFDGDNKLYNDYLINLKYVSKDSGVSPTGIPDTGGLMQNNNISNSDYLITGLIVFGIVAAGGFVYINRHDKKATTNSRSRK